MSVGTHKDSCRELLLSLLRLPGWYHKAFCPFCHLIYFRFFKPSVSFSLGLGTTDIYTGAVLTGLHTSESLFKSQFKWPIMQQARLVKILDLIVILSFPVLVAVCNMSVSFCAYLLLHENRALSGAASPSGWRREASSVL